MKNQFFHAMKNLSDEEYLDLLCRAEKEPLINGYKMPGFPDAEIQQVMVGSAGAQTLSGEGRIFYGIVKKYASTFKVPIMPDTTILDFGCGFGRMIRFYFKDIYEENIYGTDVTPSFVDICKETLHYGSYSVNNPLPPTHYADDSFDIIYAYSVFSHLASEVAELWIKELSRILKPNGLLVATTQSEGFLDYCKILKDDPSQVTSVWHVAIKDAFSPIEESRRHYRNGEFLYAPTGGGGVLDASFYGEAIVPKAHIKNIFGRHLTFRAFSFNPSELFQAVFVLQKA